MANRHNPAEAPATDLSSRVFNIPAGNGFADALVRGILAETGNDPLALTQYRILLPTRRGCRTVRDSFLRQSEGRPLILPRLQTLGDIDEDELSLQLASTEDRAAFLALKPAMPGTRRRLMLARLVQQKDRTLAYGQALGLADTLARLLDQVETEGLSLSALPGLVPPGDLATHWQHTVTFLEILSVAWPGILEEAGYMGAGARRDALLRLQASIWERDPPPGHTIAAGSTGSLPATALLIRAIAGLPRGRVVLPGLDQEMDQAAWDAVDDSHPQATLKNLLQHIGTERCSIKLWNAATSKTDDRSKIRRQKLVTEMMRPATESQSWPELQAFSLLLDTPSDLQEVQQKIWNITCETPEEEARLLALALRRTLERPGKTAALITPDRNLARRVAMACRKWGIEVDDSAGIPMGDTPVGTFMLLILEACSRKMAPGAVLALLRHEYCGLGLSHEDRAAAIAKLDQFFLRGSKPAAGAQGLIMRIEERSKEQPSLQSLADQSIEIIKKIDAALNFVLQLDRTPGQNWLTALIRSAEALADTPDLSGPERLWAGAAGEAASQFLAELMGHAHEMPELTAYELSETLSRMMAGIAVRTPVGVHPRLFILGQLEARLVQADIMLMGGLNEGMWPPDPGHDPWMSRPMRARFGLPAPERSIALAAHDFVQCFCAEEVVMTRARRIDGKPAIPSRWLQRLETVLRAAGIQDGLLYPPEAQQLLACARMGQISPDTTPAPRPAPCPPHPHRLSRLSITQVETLMTNPYGVYAREILKLPVLDPVEKPVDAAARGTFIHNVLDAFIMQYKDQIPENAEKILIDMGLVKRTAMADDSGSWDYWWPRFERLTSALIGHEREWRTQAVPHRTETKGEMVIPTASGPLKLRGRADRIDRMRDGTYALIDYKSGGTYSPKAMISGELPQLPLEAAIMEQGGFAEAGLGRVGYIGYWKLTGGREEMAVTALGPEDSDLLKTAIEQAREGFAAMIEIFARADTAFTCRPDPARPPRFDDYKHLARVDEWTNDDNQTEDAA